MEVEAEVRNVEKPDISADNNSLGTISHARSEQLHDVENQTYTDYVNHPISDYSVEHSDEEADIEPPREADNIPDLFGYLRSLGELNDLKDQSEPPSLFNRPEHVDRYKNISSLKYKAEDGAISQYVEEFESHVKDDVLMIADISLEQIQGEEERLRDQQISKEKEEMERQKMLKQELSDRENEAKRRHAHDMKREKQRLARLVELGRNREKLQNDLLHHAYWRSQTQLEIALQRRKYEVKKLFGKLSNAEGVYGGAQGKRWKVDWDKAPQPIQVKLKSLRGVRDKLPGGNYVLMVSLYNRLGGHIIRWSHQEGQYWAGSSLPVLHDGHFYNQEIKLNQSVYTVMPSKPSLRPGMILGFELLLLAGTVLPADRVVAWGAFPVCDGSFEVIEGKYKAPMVRGEMDLSIDKHAEIERIISRDLDHWLCNLYFEIVRLPRYIGGEKEYEVELQFSSLLVNHPDRINLDGEEYKDSENPILGSIATTRSRSTDSVSSLVYTSKTGSTISLNHRLNVHSDDYSDSDSITESMMKPRRRRLNLHGDAHIGDDSSSEVPRHRMALSEKGKNNLNDSDTEEDIHDEDIFVIKKETEEFQPVQDDPGLYFRQHLNNPVDIYTKKVYSQKSKAPVNQMKKRKLTNAEELELHTASVKPAFSEKGRLASVGWKRVSYIVRMFLAELGLSEWASREFWQMIFLFIFTFFMRMFLHYTGQYIFLFALGIPVNSFNFLPYTVHLNYQHSLLNALQETCLVVIGPLTILLFLVIGVVLSWLCQRLLGMFPDVGSKFLLALGIQSFFDPIFIMVVDLGQQNYDYTQLATSVPLADFTKLYWLFLRTQGNGLGGIAVTALLYLFTLFASASIVYMYFLRLHNNGRLLDTYWRLHKQHDELFVPYDLEMSLQELDEITRRAEAWRGEDGARRKVAVYDYVWEQEEELSVFDKLKESKRNKREKTTHIAIHTLHADGLRELHRHFLILPDWAILEVFGEMSHVPGLSKDIKKAVNMGARKLENLMNLGSTSTLGKLGRSFDSVQTPLTGKAINLSVPPSGQGSIPSIPREVGHDDK